MKRIYKLTMLAVALLLVSVFSLGCAAPAAPAESPDPTPAATEAATEAPADEATPEATEAAADAYTVKFAPFVSYTGIGTWLGFEKGFFSEDGLKTEEIILDDKISGLISGDVDFADLNTSQAITATAQGAPFKIVGSMFRTKGAFYLIGAPDINEISDLKGKVVGIAMAGSGLDAYTRVMLKENGLDPDKDVTLLANGVYQQAYASLQTGQVSATIIHQPFVELAEKEGVGKLLGKGYEYLPTFHTGVLVASDKFIAEHPDELRKIIKAYYKSWTYAKENLDETIEFGSKYVEIDPEILRAVLESELEIWANEPSVDINSLNDTQDTQIELGFQEEKYDLTPYIDQSFLPES